MKGCASTMDELMILAAKQKWDVWYHNGTYFRKRKSNPLFIQTWTGKAWSLFDSLSQLAQAA